MPFKRAFMTAFTALRSKRGMNRVVVPVVYACMGFGSMWMWLQRFQSHVSAFGHRAGFQQRALFQFCVKVTRLASFTYAVLVADRSRPPRCPDDLDLPVVQALYAKVRGAGPLPLSRAGFVARLPPVACPSRTAASPATSAPASSSAPCAANVHRGHDPSPAAARARRCCAAFSAPSLISACDCSCPIQGGCPSHCQRQH
jgi:hypothetical protein